MFASHRERSGASAVDLDLADGATVEVAFGNLVERYPALAPTEPFTSFARNREMVDVSETLHEGDELALLQPVSGGGR